MLNLPIKDSFLKQLIADTNIENSSRQVYGAHFSLVEPRIPSNPSLIHYSEDMIEQLGMTEEGINSSEFLHIFSGKEIYPNTRPYAMSYAGHQFGHWAGQLGDGRAINLFEIFYKEKRWAIQLKGAGKTPYSRNADGLAVLRSSIREYLCSEAMNALGVPTTRALSIVLTGDEVMRDMLYDGNARLEKGAIVSRVAPSFIRFGNFELFASRKDIPNLILLTDYTIGYFYPHIKAEGKEKYLQFFQEVSLKTMDLMIHWQRVGFVHGVMNTDNMSILGLTIDYGPYGWLENYDPTWTPNTTDAQDRRYRFENQPEIGLWNLVQLANAIYPLIEDVDSLEKILNESRTYYLENYERMMAAKLGIDQLTESTKKIIDDLEKLMSSTEVDMTIFYRNLSKLSFNYDSNAFLKIVNDSIYDEDRISEEIKIRWIEWFHQYKHVVKQENQDLKERRRKMDLINPKYVLRNYMAQMAIDEAEKGDYNLIDELYRLLLKPYDEQIEYEKWFAKRPEWARRKIGSSMLSCSS